MLMSSAKRISRSILMGVLVVIAVMLTFVGCNQSIAAVRAGTGNGSPGDPNIKYVGRWEKSIDTAISYWPGAYLTTKFTGATVKVKLSSDRKELANIYVSIDGGPDILYAKASGTVNLTPTPLKRGKIHALRIAAASEHDDIRFQGLILASGSTTVASSISPKLVEFIGDSITAGTKNKHHVLDTYGWLIGERLAVRHTQIAQGGISLFGSLNAVGMKDQYFKLRTVYFPTSPDWDFVHNQANAVVINIGTNEGRGTPFQSTYTTFLQNIRAKYPHAQIFVLRLFKGGKLQATQDAVKAVNDAGDRNVHYIDTTNWINVSLTASDTFDTVHPTCIGHTKIADKLGPIIAPFLGISWKPLPIPSSCPTH